MRKIICFVLLLAVVLPGGQSCKPQKNSMEILIYTKTEGFRHEAIEAAKAGFEQLAIANNWVLTFSENEADFRTDSLQHYGALVFLLTTGSTLDDEGKDALSAWVEAGGGLLTVHSGSDTEKEWPWFVNAVGARFTGHPPVQPGKLIVEDLEHPAIAFLGDSIWWLEDEWYSFDRNPRENVHVLISIDEESYRVDDNRWFEGVEQRMGDHPLVWYQRVGEGRVLQTALGHRPELYSDSLFLKHLQGALRWAAGLE